MLERRKRVLRCRDNCRKNCTRWFSLGSESSLIPKQRIQGQPVHSICRSRLTTITRSPIKNKDEMNMGWDIIQDAGKMQQIVNCSYTTRLEKYTTTTWTTQNRGELQ